MAEIDQLKNLERKVKVYSITKKLYDYYLVGWYVLADILRDVRDPQGKNVYIEEPILDKKDIGLEWHNKLYFNKIKILVDKLDDTQLDCLSKL